ncbi:unnamed protein product [Vitrella brassicaformis CCMP3155]|uniref:Uncharacterized protein n=2 Tax=Vitrella brassicaformis TaxID=1169539 RepID=A0A0G4G5U1_VITBC|nr:unnamed protein product [Vitrella brassicaformis CCMP3155]|eukprot:CEM23461.1 unnamed protein product [Vitrella brassicaformis CCMP3155]
MSFLATRSGVSALPYFLRLALSRPVGQASLRLLHSDGKAIEGQRLRKLCQQPAHFQRIVSNAGVRCVLDLLVGIEVRRTHEGAQADLAVRPVAVEADDWMPVQVKSTKAVRKEEGADFSPRTYHFFRSVQGYPSMPVICVSLDVPQIWLFDGSVLARGPHHLKVTEGKKWDVWPYRCNTKKGGRGSLSARLLDAYDSDAFMKTSLETILRQRSSAAHRGALSTERWRPLLDKSGIERVDDWGIEGSTVDEIWATKAGKKLHIQHKLAYWVEGSRGCRVVLKKYKAYQPQKRSNSFQRYDEKDFDALALALPPLAPHSSLPFLSANRYLYLIPMAALVERQMVNGAKCHSTSPGSAVYLYPPNLPIEPARRANRWTNAFLIDQDATDKGVGHLLSIIDGFFP